MGARGPAPTPTALKIVRGNPGKRPLNKREPKPRIILPHCPDHLDESAKAEWKRLVKILTGMKVLTEADYMALANLAQTWSTMVKAQEQLSKTGVLFKTPSGYVQQSPLVGIVNNCISIITKLGQEFGVTPASRSRISANEDKESSNPFAEFG